MHKFKIISLTAGIAATLTLSCSNGDDNTGGGGSPVTETYTLENKTATQFTYTEVEKDDERCSNGVLEEREYPRTIHYSIQNNIMTWQDEYADDDTDTLHLKGTSNELTGTWTRTKNKASSCRLYTEKYCINWESGGCNDYEEETWYGCKEGYDITQAVFTETTLKITRDECWTDEVENGRNYKGWIMKVIDCDATEYSKGSEKLTYRETRTTEVINYKGRSCSYQKPTKAQKQAACQKAWNENKDYWDILDEAKESYHNCLEGLLPPEFRESREKHEVEPLPPPPPVAKAKITPLLKKKNQRYTFF